MYLFCYICNVHIIVLVLNDKTIWMRSQTLLLIDLYKKHLAEFNDKKTLNRSIWSKISKQIEIECKKRFTSQFSTMRNKV